MHAAGFCDSTPFKDSSGDYTFGESRCTGVDQVNFSLYNKPAGESVLNDCNASTYFNSWALTVGSCQMVAAPCNSPTGSFSPPDPRPRVMPHKAHVARPSAHAFNLQCARGAALRATVVS